MAAKRRQLVTVIDGPLVDRAEALVRENRSMARVKLPGWKQLTPGAQTELIETLVSRGLELGEKGVLRVPLAEQVASLGERGARLPLRDAQKRIAGASSTERDAALADACKGGKLHLVVRTNVETIVDGAEDVLGDEDVEVLVQAHAALGAVLERVQKRGPAGAPLARARRTLLREDTVALIAPLARWTAGDGSHASGGRHISLEAVLERIRSLEEPPVLLVWIPDLIRGLADRVSTAEAHRALFELRARGLVELRPESGVCRLPREEEALCPVGEGGLLLPHVLRL